MAFACFLLSDNLDATTLIHNTIKCTCKDKNWQHQSKTSVHMCNYYQGIYSKRKC